MRIGQLDVQLKHASDSKMLLGDTPAGLAVVALKALGRADGSTPELVAQLRRVLDDTDKKRLLRVRGRVPRWMAETVDQLVPAERE